MSWHLWLHQSTCVSGHLCVRAFVCCLHTSHCQPSVMLIKTRETHLSTLEPTHFFADCLRHNGKATAQTDSTQHNLQWATMVCHLCHVPKVIQSSRPEIPTTLHIHVNGLLPLRLGRVVLGTGIATGMPSRTGCLGSFRSRS